VLPINVERMGVNGFTTTYAINLTGNTVANELWGNDGVNVIDGRSGADILHGNGGADTFAFTTALGGGNVDSIVDFAPGADKFALDDAVFSGLTPGALDPGAFRVGTTGAQDADDRIIYNSTTGALYFDADGNGAGAAVQFATVQSALSLTASDFTVI
jgi:Ca2+-binding RTX toxin-like protein